MPERWSLPAFQIAISGGDVPDGVLIRTQGPVAVMAFLGFGALAGAAVMATRSERRCLSVR